MTITANSLTIPILQGSSGDYYHYLLDLRHILVALCNKSYPDGRNGRASRMDIRGTD